MTIECYLPIGWHDYLSGILQGLGFVTVIGVGVAWFWWTRLQ